MSYTLANSQLNKHYLNKYITNIYLELGKIWGQIVREHPEKTQDAKDLNNTLFETNSQVITLKEKQLELIIALKDIELEEIVIWLKESGKNSSEITEFLDVNPRVRLLRLKLMKAEIMQVFLSLEGGDIQTLTECEEKADRYIDMCKPPLFSSLHDLATQLKETIEEKRNAILEAKHGAPDTKEDEALARKHQNQINNHQAQVQEDNAFVSSSESKHDSQEAQVNRDANLAIELQNFEVAKKMQQDIDADSARVQADNAFVQKNLAKWMSEDH